MAEPTGKRVRHTSPADLNLLPTVGRDQEPTATPLPSGVAAEDAVAEDAARETAEILADQALLAALKRGIADLHAGRVVPFEQIEHELEL